MGYSTGTVTYTSVEGTKQVNAMEDKEIYCGECDKFLYEDACGYGDCEVNGDKCYCGDLCHLTHGKP